MGIRDTVHAFGRLENSFETAGQIQKYESHFLNFMRMVITDNKKLAHEYLRKPYITDLQEKIILDPKYKCLDPTQLYIYKLGQNDDSYEQILDTINGQRIKPDVTQFLQDSLK